MPSFCGIVLLIADLLYNCTNVTKWNYFFMSDAFYNGHFALPNIFIYCLFVLKTRNEHLFTRLLLSKYSKEHCQHFLFREKTIYMFFFTFMRNCPFKIQQKSLNRHKNRSLFFSTNLILPCRFCLAVSVEKNVLSFFSHFLKVTSSKWWIIHPTR